MKLSNRLTSINGEPGADDGWSVYYRAQSMLAAGEDVTMLCIGEHDRSTAPFILDAMNAAARDGNTGYASARGMPALREAIAARATARTGVATAPESVIVTTGGQAALFAAMSAVADPGETVVVVDPYYATYPATVHGPGARMKVVEARADRGFQIDPGDLMAATLGAKALLINTPHNPTGAVYDDATLEGIRAACVENDLWLISDEVYDGQIHDGAHVSPRRLPGMAERTFVVGSLSKSHVMTGFRLGWLVGPSEAIEALVSLANATTYGVPGFIQEAAIAALRDGADEEAAVAALYTRRRDKAVAALAVSNVVSLSPPQGAMYVMVDVRATGLSGEAFAMRLLEDEKIAVMPGESFGRAAAGHVRVALTIEDERMVDALRRLAALGDRLAS